MGNHNIRHMVPSDLDAFRACLEFETGAEPHMLTTSVVSSAAAKFVADGGSGPPRGYMVCRRVVSHWVIDELLVEPRWRRRGVGTALVAHVVERNTSQRPIAIRVADFAVDSQAFLRSLGFLCRGIERGKSDGGRDRFIFVKTM